MSNRHFAAALLLTLISAPAHADYHLFSPYEIDLGELEIEHNGDSTFDRDHAKDSAQSYTIELGTGLTPWWHTEIEFGFDRDPGIGQPTLLTQLVTENMFQLTEPGEDFADFGFYAEYGQSVASGAHAGANAVTAGPVIGKDIGRTTTLINLFLSRELGPNQSSHGIDFSYAWQTRWNIWRPLSPAIEFYGDAGNIGHSPKFADQQFLVGPVGIGSLNLASLGLGHGGRLKYEVGWLFGATEATAAGTLRWRLELEIPF